MVTYANTILVVTHGGLNTMKVQKQTKGYQYNMIRE